MFADAIRRLPLALDPERGKAAREAVPGATGDLARLIEGAAGSSPYLAGLLAREGAWLASALDAEDVVAAETEGFEALDPAALGAGLRRAKRRIALLTALADLGGVWPLERVTGTLTALADRAVDLAFRAHLAPERARGRLPEGGADAAGLILLAMGKMGAGELNYSSDIDLIVLYDDEAYAPADRQEARAALIRVTRRAAATLSDLTAEGYVFRTDLRLRPDAAVTPVCMSASAALDYYEAEGRTWERAAYIKARPCGGDLGAGVRFLEALRPFVWRRHLDFAAIEDAHGMRLRIRAHRGLGGEIAAPGHDMKLGQGGIREIEFFTQTRQLIAGGRDPSLRLRGTVEGLAALAAAGWVPRADAEELADHYRHHREIEHRIQMVNDTQTHALSAPGPALDAVARLSGAEDTAAWAEGIRQRLVRVEALTGAFFAPSPAQPLPELSETAEQIVARWRSYPALRGTRARTVFRRIEADLLMRLTRAAHPDDALARFDGFLAGLPAGVQVFSLFEANPQLIDLVADICGTSPGLAAHFARHPGVLDSVIAGSFFAPWPGERGLRDALAAAVATALRGPGGGYERALDAARRFAHDWQFRTGVHHLRGLVDAEEAARQYADIADAVLGVLFAEVAAEFATRHGKPPGRGAVVLGMGSLGARQLNAASDLDLIVVYDPGRAEASDGPKPLPARTYYARLTQALLTALSAPTAEGRLYEVDMRLRPSGRQGAVATSLASFHDYQMTEAWTWEHLALTRARPVAFAGAPALMDEIEALRLEILAARGTDPRVLPDLAAMRARLAGARPSAGPWDAKAGPGRLQDIELLAQSLALRTADPARASTAQLRAGRRAGLIGAEDAERLASARRLMWRVHAGTRLIGERRVDLAGLGQGAQAFLLREAGMPDLGTLAERLEEAAQHAAALIEAQIGEAAAAAGGPGG
ncbi:glutamine-synthetase adenylyltransferase [Paracoccus sp. S-4012]|uniref:[protein-PII] uridylyltransferase family protein n=1 Tax=Paracoccus sp. S-4012 TaxID=2665648 RepID=UPI0012B07502|nr:glutamine-synthetase adenylyltransferase [Paracoccus sp. S-4012]MRX49367.1 glutamine-synthetase adenylyltransferase [Paracoccus sp. S-4012]